MGKAIQWPVLGCFFALLIAGPGPVLAQESSPPVNVQGKAVAVKGSVQFRNPQVMLWNDLKLGQTLTAGDRIRTGEDGQLKIEMNDGNFLYVKPNSEIFIEKLTSDPATGKYESVFEVINAQIKAEVHDQTNLRTFEIRTPTSVAGVRGTIFYVNATRFLTEIFVERGNVNLRNNISNQERDVQPGFSTTSDEHGEVSEPFMPPPERLQELQGAWEFGSSADIQKEEGDDQVEASADAAESIDSFAEEFQEQQEHIEQDQADSLLDRQFSQEAVKTDYIVDPPLATGAPGADTDGDGIINGTDTDDDNDFMLDAAELSTGTDVLNKDSDADGLTDWEEVNLQGSNPRDTDSDNDTIIDGNDPFPLDPALGYSVSPIRTFRYAKINTTTVPALRAEIQSMLADSNERQRDYIMDRISDAQTVKVLRDFSGEWTRLEQYIFRPSDQEINILNVSFRGGLAAPYSSMYVKLEFNNSLNSLTSHEIRNLPWETYFSDSFTTLDYGTATAPTVYPVKESVKFENTGGINYVQVQRTLGAVSCSPNCVQAITADTFTVNNPGFGVNAVTDTYTVNPPPTASNSGGNTAATVFYVSTTNFGFGPMFANFSIRPIDANGAIVGNFTFDNIWDVLGTNLTGFNQIGTANYVEINVSMNGGASTNVVYVPIRSMLWRGDAAWPDELTW
jgi:hypothetical protein